MHPDIKNVIELQQVDLKIEELTKQIDSLPARFNPSIPAWMSIFTPRKIERSS